MDKLYAKQYLYLKFSDLVNGNICGDVSLVLRYAPIGCYYHAEPIPQPSNSSLCFHQRPTSLRVLQWLKKVPILAYQAASPGRCSRPCSLARSRSVITPQILNYSLNATTIAQHVRYANTYCAQPSPAPSWCASFQWP